MQGVYVKQHESWCLAARCNYGILYQPGDTFGENKIKLATCLNNLLVLAKILHTYSSLAMFPTWERG